jgi:hypothetical protein
MIIDKPFFRKILIFLFGSFLIAGYPMYLFASQEVIVAVIAGAVISTINIFLGYVSIEIAYGKSMTKFMKWIFGGMGLRLLILLAAIYIAVKVLQFHLFGFIVSLFAFYSVYLILEIIYIDQKVRNKIS